MLVIDIRKIVGLAACAVVLFSLFAPAAVVPFVGPMSLMGIRIVGPAILVATLISGALILTGGYDTVWLTGICGVAIAGYAYYSLFMAHGTNGFDAIIQAVVQPSWGWGLFGVGMFGVFAAAAEGPWDRDIDSETRGDMRDA